jgi:hypothetical protein
MLRHQRQVVFVTGEPGIGKKFHWPAGEFTREPPKFLSEPRTSNQASATAKSAEWLFSNLRIP